MRFQLNHNFDAIIQKPLKPDFEVMEILTKQVAAQLEERPFCVVFENDLERCWPRKEIMQSEREREIQAFAESQGWTAAIVDGPFGTRAIFERLESE